MLRWPVCKTNSPFKCASINLYNVRSLVIIAHYMFGFFVLKVKVQNASNLLAVEPVLIQKVS